MTRHHSCRVSPFGHPRIHARLAAPRGISQPPTSFIGSQCQGIHHAPLNTYNTKTKNSEKSKIAHQHTQQHSPNTKTAHHLRARCSQPLSTNQTPHPTTKDGATTTPHPPQRGGPPSKDSNGPVASKPNSVSGNSVTEQPYSHRSRRNVCCCTIAPADTHYRRRPSTNRPTTEPPHDAGGPGISWCSLERR